MVSLLDRFRRLRRPAFSAPKYSALEPQFPGSNRDQDIAAGQYFPCGLETVLDAVRACGFSGEAYLAANPDLQSHYPTPAAASRHFLLAVRTERRRFPIQLSADALTGLHQLPVTDRSLMASLLACLGDAALDMGPLPRPDRVPELIQLAGAFRPVGGRCYMIVGDSHSTLYRRSSVRDGEFLVPLHVCCSAGSAIGLNNGRSRSGYGELLRNLFLSLLPSLDMPIFIEFGQVDLEFVHPFRRIRSGVERFDRDEFLAFCDASVKAYVGFLERVFPPEHRTKVTVLGVFPPALDDRVLRAGYVNGHIADLEEMGGVGALKLALQRLEWPGLTERTALHAEYNSRLQAALAKSGLAFVSDFDALLAANGVLDRRHIPFGKGEQHHLDLAPTEELVSARLWRSLDDSRPVAPGQRRADGRVITFADLTEELAPELLPPLDRREGVDTNSLTDEQRAWHRDGAVILPGFLPDDLVEAYVESRARDAGPAGWLMPTPYLHVPELRALALYPPLLRVIESLVGEEMLLHLALTAWLSTEREWHQDDYLNPPFVASWYAAVWMALDDISPDSGPFEYLPGSHRWELMRLEKVRSFLTEEELGRREPVTGNNDWPKYAERYVTPAVERRVEESGLPIRRFLGGKGDVLIWHGRLMHRGSRPRTPGAPRRSLITHYSGVSHRPDMPNRVRDSAGGLYAYFDHELK